MTDGFYHYFSRTTTFNCNFISIFVCLCFVTGRRICLGESLARMELFLFVVSLVQRFELYPEDDQSQPALQPHFGVTRSPQPFKFRAVPREWHLAYFIVQLSWGTMEYICPLLKRRGILSIACTCRFVYRSVGRFVYRRSPTTCTTGNPRKLCLRSFKLRR